MVLRWLMSFQAGVWRKVGMNHVCDGVVEAAALQKRVDVKKCLT